MRSLYIFSILVITLHLVSDNYVAADACPQENCIEDGHCEEQSRNGAECPNAQDICCSVVKSEFRTACRHHGGECMDSCPESLRRTVTDCDDNQVCCVLV